MEKCLPACNGLMVSGYTKLDTKTNIGKWTWMYRGRRHRSFLWQQPDRKPKSGWTIKVGKSLPVEPFLGMSFNFHFRKKLLKTDHDTVFFQTKYWKRFMKNMQNTKESYIFLQKSRVGSLVCFRYILSKLNNDFLNCRSWVETQIEIRKNFLWYSKLWKNHQGQSC